MNTNHSQIYRTFFLSILVLSLGFVFCLNTSQAGDEKSGKILNPVVDTLNPQVDKSTPTDSTSGIITKMENPSEAECARYRSEREALRIAIRLGHPPPSIPTSISQNEATCLERERERAIGEREAAARDNQCNTLRGSMIFFESRQKGRQEQACARRDYYNNQVNNLREANCGFFGRIFTPGTCAYITRDTAIAMANVYYQEAICRSNLVFRCTNPEGYLADLPPHGGDEDISLSTMRDLDREVCNSYARYVSAACPTSLEVLQDRSIIDGCACYGVEWKGSNGHEIDF